MNDTPNVGRVNDREEGSRIEAGGGAEMIDVESFWGPEFPTLVIDPPLASAERVHEWEARYGVRLPATLAAALAIH